MAAVTYGSSLSNAMATLFANDITKAINRAIVLAQVLAVVPADSKNITWQVKTGVAEATDPTFNDGADISTYNADTRLPATLEYGRYQDAFSISGFARAAARVTANPSQMQNLFTDEMNDACERLGRGIARDLYSGTGATNYIAGLFASVPAIGDTGTYAGIDRGTYTQWKGSVVDAGGADIGFTMVQTLNRLIYTASGQHPDLYVTTPIQFQKVGLLYGVNRRYFSLAEVPNVDGKKIRLDGGWNALEMDGKPILEDAQATAGNFAALTMKDIRIRQMPDTIDEVNRALGNVQLSGTEEIQLGPGRMRMSARVQPLSTTGDASKFALIAYPQLQVRNCFAHGYLTNLRAAL